MADVNVPQLAVKITLNQKDVTTTLSEFVTSISCTDSVNEFDNITLTLDDSSGKWRSDWYPVKTDELSIEFGYREERPIKVAGCLIDTIDLSGSPDIVVINAKSGQIDKAMQTKVSKAYDGATLREIVEAIAKKHGLKVVGKIEDIKFVRRTQSKMSDEAFLKKLAEDYGYYLAIKKGQLIFEKKTNVKKTSSPLELTKQHCLRYSFRDRTSQVYKACTVSYWDSKSKKVITHTENAAGLKTGDTLIIKDRVENLEQAKELARSALTAKNERQVEATISVPGQNCYVAGVQLNLTGFGILSGVYTVTKAVHSISAAGWTVQLTASRNELKKDDPKEENRYKNGAKTCRRFSPSVQYPNSWTSITDDTGMSFPCINETAYRFEKLRELVHKQWPGRTLWVSCTTGGQHSSSAHGQGRAIDCGIYGLTASESYTLEELAQSAGFYTYNEYVYSSQYNTGDHMHIYI